MYKKLVKIKNNTINIDVDYFCEIIKDEENHDKIIEYVIKINKKILKKYETFNYVISMESVSLYDLYYFEFFKNLIF